MRLLKHVVAAFLFWQFSAAASALADDLVVKRNVTLRAEPDRRSAIVDFPAIGSHLTLVDDGTRVRGYLHAKTTDGRLGWVYYSFVTRVPSAEPEALLAAAPSMTVHYIDVDQGAAALAEFSCGAILIDAGGRGDAAGNHLIAFLDAFFARRPDLNRTLAGLIITHTHKDHNLNLQRVVERYRVMGYVDNGVMTGSGRYAAAWMATRTANGTPAIARRSISSEMVEAAGPDGFSDAIVDPVACAGVDPRIRVLSGRYDTNPGWSDGDFENGNNQSLAVRIDFNNSSYLFTGDMEEAGLETLVDKYNGNLNADVWLVSHHGADNGITASFVQALTPKIAVISMGHLDSHDMWTAWAYGHPRRNTVSALDAALAFTRPSISANVATKPKTFAGYPLSHALYATGWDGDVRISTMGDGNLSVVTGQ